MESCTTCHWYTPVDNLHGHCHACAGVVVDTTPESDKPYTPGLVWPKVNAHDRCGLHEYNGPAWQRVAHKIRRWVDA